MSPRAAACLALGIALGGCERSPDGGTERTENQASMVVGSLLLTLETDDRTYQPGEPIALQLKLNNRSNRDTTLQFSSGQRYDFQIADASGQTAWTWSADRAFMQALGTEQLAADGALEYGERFTGRLAPGNYKVTGFITTLGTPLQASTTITVQ